MKINKKLKLFHPINMIVKMIENDWCDRLWEISMDLSNTTNLKQLTCDILIWLRHDIRKTLE